MKIYVAGSYTDRARIEEEALRLTIKHRVLGQWWSEDYFVEKAWHDNPQNQHFDGPVAEAMGMIDSYHVKESDTVIVDTIGQTSTGGREVEFGLALGSGKRVIRIGPCRNVFHQLAREHYDTWEAFWQRFK